MTRPVKKEQFPSICKDENGNISIRTSQVHDEQRIVFVCLSEKE